MSNTKSMDPKLFSSSSSYILFAHSIPSAFRANVSNSLSILVNSEVAMLYYKIIKIVNYFQIIFCGHFTMFASL